MQHLISNIVLNYGVIQLDTTTGIVNTARVKYFIRIRTESRPKTKQP